jgi:Ser/Thr protein kinase RdoA (MazF antagonist)
MPVDLTELRPALTGEIMQVVSDRFGIDPVAMPKDLGGSFSLNVLIEAPAERYVVRVHGTQNEPARLHAIQQARRHLTAGGVPAPEHVVTLDRAPFVTVGGHLVEVERYVEHDANMNTWHRLEHGLPSLGRTHELFRSLQVGAAGSRAPLANHIEPEQALADTLRGVQRIRAWNPTPDEIRVAALFEELAHLVHEAEHNATRGLPRQLVHGDFWDNNVLFRGEAVALVTDLDFMAERLRIDDVALTLFFANSSIGGDQLSSERIEQLATLVDAYDSGLSDRLSKAERQALPAAIARQTLWSIGRWVPALPEDRARGQVAWRAIDAEWTLGLMHNLREWQYVFATERRCA